MISDKIGIIGICGFGGMALNAAALDTRIKATIIPRINTKPFNIDICYLTVFDLYLKAENKRIYKNG